MLCTAGSSSCDHWRHDTGWRTFPGSDRALPLGAVTCRAVLSLAFRAASRGIRRSRSAPRLALHRRSRCRTAARVPHRPSRSALSLALPAARSPCNASRYRTTRAGRATASGRREPAIANVRAGEWTSWSVSRVLFPGASRRSRSATIHLGVPLPTRSSGSPAGSGGQPSNACAHPAGTQVPAWCSQPCSGWGLPSRTGHPARWWSLTPPFHPYPAAPGPRPGHRVAVCSLWHCPAARAGLPLTTTLPCGARTFLGGPPRTASRRGRPTNSSALDSTVGGARSDPRRRPVTAPADPPSALITIHRAHEVGH